MHQPTTLPLPQPVDFVISVDRAQLTPPRAARRAKPRPPEAEPARDICDPADFAPRWWRAPEPGE